MTRSAVILAAAAIFLATAFSAARADGVPEALRACGDEKDDAKRLACFDGELARASEPPPAPQPAAAMLTPEERFGRAGVVSRDENKREEKKHAPAIKELTATVVGLTTRMYGEFVMTLDNGQVWAQPAPDPHFSIKPGDKVTIKAGVLGSFGATSPNGRSTKVVRVK